MKSLRIPLQTSLKIYSKIIVRSVYYHINLLGLQHFKVHNNSTFQWSSKIKSNKNTKQTNRKPDASIQIKRSWWRVCIHVHTKRARTIYIFDHQKDAPWKCLACWTKLSLIDVFQQKIKTNKAMQVNFVIVLNLTKFHTWKFLFIWIMQERHALQPFQIW